MTHTRLWLAAAIIGLVIVVSFVLSVPHTRLDQPRTDTALPVSAIVPAVTLKDSYKKGVHTISGSLEAPNACTEIDATATLESGVAGPERITIALTMPPSTGICLELPTRIHFETTVTAPAQLPITATVNGDSATTTAS